MESLRVVIVGGGFGGLNLAKRLCGSPYQVTLIDKKNHHLFQPLLYQVATAGLSPADISVPLRHEFFRCPHTDVVLGEVKDVLTAEQTVVLSHGDKIPYDYLVLATGSTHSYFAHSDWEKSAPGLKTLEDAIDLRRRILLAFEDAENFHTNEPLHFVIVGGGPTGVELAGAICELAKKTLSRDYRHIHTQETQVYLVEAGPRLLPAFHPLSSERAQKSLEDLGVVVLVNSMVTGFTDTEVQLKDGRRLRSSGSFWAAGVKPSPAASWLKCESDRIGRVKVDSFCRVPSIKNVFVIGDTASFEQEGKVLPGVAPVAIQQGKYVARYLKRMAKGKEPKPFHYVGRGNLATIGRNRAVAEFGKLSFSGFVAWVLWAFVHILYLIGFRNRASVLLQWTWSYMNYQGGARLITEMRKEENPQ